MEEGLSNNNQSVTKVAEQCIWVKWFYEREGMPDTHIVRIKEHYSDGTKKSVTRVLTDYERPYYITRKNCRDYKQKKAVEHIDNLLEFQSTQSNLMKNIINKLDMKWFKGAYYKIPALTPYLYGSDTSAACILKQNINAQMPDDLVKAGASLASMDSETDVLRGNGDNFWMMSIANDDLESHVYVSKEFFNNEASVKTFTCEEAQQKIDALVEEHLGEYDTTKIKTIIVENEKEVILQTFETLRKWDRDYTAVFNIDYDISRVFARCQVLGIDPAVLFHDSDAVGDLPPLTDYNNYVNRIKATDWWDLKTTSGTQWVCQWAWYKSLRGQQQKLVGGYGFDNLLRVEVKKSKLKVGPNPDEMTGLEFHVKMQGEYQPEYCLYAHWDALGMIVLNNKTEDISYTLPNLDSEMSRIDKPSCVNDDVFYGVNKVDGLINGTYRETDHIVNLEGNIFSLSKWIKVLRPELYVGRVLKRLLCINPNNSVIGYNQDADFTSSYPIQLSTTNASLSTTVYELFASQKGTDEKTLRQAIQHRTCGYAGSMEIATELLNLPKFDEIDEMVRSNKL